MNEIGIITVFIAGLLAGMMNAAAGGGSFVTVPALIFLGIPPISANMSSTIALYPGSLISAWVYRDKLKPIGHLSNKILFLTILSGGFLGAFLLLITPNSSFSIMIPWLLLFGSLMFAFGQRIGSYLKRYEPPNALLLLIILFFLGIYGGYFGGAVGIMIMAVLSILGETDIKAINALKVILVAAANTVAVLCFATLGVIAWQTTIVMLVAATMGGFLGAHIILNLKPAPIRLGINLVNFIITGLFFYAKVF